MKYRVLAVIAILSLTVSASPQDCTPQTTVEGCVNCYVANFYEMAAQEGANAPSPQQHADAERDAAGFCYPLMCLPLRGACPAPDCIGPRPLGCS